jgi:hypothetical protein
VPVVLAALPEVVVALVLVLILWAARSLFGGMLSSMASRIPFLGSVLATAIDAVIGDSVTAAESLARSGIAAVEGWILGPVFWFEHILADIWDTFDVLRQVVAYITGTLIQLAVNIAVTEARALIARAVAQLEALINSVYTITQVEFRQVYATLNAVERTLEAYIAAEFAAAEAYTTRAIEAETAYVNAIEHALQSEITSAITAETAFVEAEFKAAIDYTASTAAAIETTIITDTSAITAWVSEQILSLTGAIDLVQAASVAFTIASVKAVETDLGNLKADCTDNLCSGVGGLASLLNQIFDTAALGALVAYAAWMGTDPQGAGHATADVLGPIAGGAVDAAHAAIGAL